MDWKSLRFAALLEAALLATAWIGVAAQAQTSEGGAVSTKVDTAAISPAPSFDVATLKPNPAAEPTSWMGIRNIRMGSREHS